MGMWCFCNLILTNFCFYNCLWNGMQAALSSEECPRKVQPTPQLSNPL